MPFVVDYKEEIKRLVAESYEPADMVSQEFRKSTIQVMEGFSNVLPIKALNAHMVYEALLELGFEPKEEEPLVYYWYFKRKD